jgi:hypothetical protein
MVIEFKGTDRPSLTGRSVALVVRKARTTDSLSLTGHSIQKIHSLYGTRKRYRDAQALSQAVGFTSTIFLNYHRFTIPERGSCRAFASSEYTNHGMWTSGR